MMVPRRRCLPAFVPSVQVSVVTPSELVVDEVGDTEPPPCSTDQLMVAPLTGLLYRSVISTSIASLSVGLTTAVMPPPLRFVCEDGLSAFALPLKVATPTT